jgi:hypothetical protein
MAQGSVLLTMSIALLLWLPSTIFGQVAGQAPAGKDSPRIKNIEALQTSTPPIVAGAASLKPDEEIVMAAKLLQVVGVPALLAKAEAGDGAAQLELALAYNSGYGIKQDFNRLLGRRLLQLCVFHFGSDEDGNVSVGFFPEREEVLIRRLGVLNISAIGNLIFSTKTYGAGNRTRFA